MSEKDMEIPVYYRVNVGVYTVKENAEKMLSRLLMQGFPAFMIYEDGYYKVQVGAYEYLDNATKMEQQVRKAGYSTFITT